MNRRHFLSTMLGAAGAPLVPWRGLVEPVIVLPTWQAAHDCGGSFWCNHPSHFKPATAEQILVDIERGVRSFIPTHVSIAPGTFELSLGGYLTTR